ncbi:MAG TPA: bifunctional rhamnulose-1-phosphate aldolase/short-chain dehydrogenase, partial [Pararhizobium sp.]|nr:bifunctional rhamnulose-1-phosphate aldolase/short-chain dehydrogenase [Pararhizobium sp.]
RPGYELGLWLEKFCSEHPKARGVVLESHGLFTWGDTAEECYETTIAIINRAIAWFEANSAAEAFGGQKVRPLPAEERQAVAARLMPVIRGMIGREERKIGHFDDSEAVLDFVCSNEFEALAPLGTSCPDHFLRTKIRPLIVDFDLVRRDLDETVAGLAEAIAAYRADYAAYYDRCKRPDSPAMRDPNAVVYLVPGVGMITFARDKATARISAEFYGNAINVMRGASSVSTYRGLPEQEAFDIEYWLLEEAKLQRMPKPKPLAGRVALVTGGAGGIGKATARRLAADGACVVLADIDQVALAAAREELSSAFGQDVVRAAELDVTSEEAVAAAFARAAVAYGGLDILVSNAGISSAAPVDETELSLWSRNMGILATGYFLVAREAFRLMKQQDTGGSIVFIASKNGLAASPNASAYCTAKAAEIHLARCLALEGAEFGIRVNTVNPDAVLRGSKIWTGEWREQRAAAYNMAPDQLEEHYRKRSMLKLSVFPEDVAEAVYFFVSDMAAKSTGNIVNVDAGNAQAFTR